jgi:energy-converting hydrogenase Eha subunit E
MKGAAKTLIIIALVIGIIWAIVGFFVHPLISGMKAGFEGVEINSPEYKKMVLKSADIGFTLFKGMGILILGSILGLIGTGKKPGRIKLLILGLLTITSGIVAFMSYNWVAAILIIVAGFLLTLAGFLYKTTPVEVPAK